jgi:hypothetical protein
LPWDGESNRPPVLALLRATLAAARPDRAEPDWRSNHPFADRRPTEGRLRLQGGMQTHADRPQAGKRLPRPTVASRRGSPRWHSRNATRAPDSPRLSASLRMIVGRPGLRGGKTADYRPAACGRSVPACIPILMGTYMDHDPDDSEDFPRRAAAGEEVALTALWQRHRARLRQRFGLRLDNQLQARVDRSDVH